MQRRFLIDYRSIWCHDFTIICITKKLEVKMPAYTSFISDVHKAILFHVLLPYKSLIFAVVIKLRLEPITRTNVEK